MNKIVFINDEYVCFPFSNTIFFLDKTLRIFQTICIPSESKVHIKFISSKKSFTSKIDEFYFLIIDKFLNWKMIKIIYDEKKKKFIDQIVHENNQTSKEVKIKTILFFFFFIIKINFYLGMDYP